MIFFVNITVKETFEEGPKEVRQLSFRIYGEIFCSVRGVGQMKNMGTH